MIIKEIVVDQVTVTENGIVLYREATRLIEDGKILTQTYYRTSLTPGQDVTNVPQKVKDICNFTWTPKVISDYEKQLKPNSLN